MDLENVTLRGYVQIQIVWSVVILRTLIDIVTFTLSPMEILFGNVISMQILTMANNQ